MIKHIQSYWVTCCFTGRESLNTSHEFASLKTRLRIGNVARFVMVFISFFGCIFCTAASETTTDSNMVTLPGFGGDSTHILQNKLVFFQPQRRTQCQSRTMGCRTWASSPDNPLSADPSPTVPFIEQLNASYPDLLVLNCHPPPIPTASNVLASPRQT